jgi:hypothetical protein
MSERAAPLRQRLIAACDALLSTCPGAAVADDR